jgi:hypothetical protein
MSKLTTEYRRLIVGSETLQALDATLTLLERATGLRIGVLRNSVITAAAPAWIPPGRSWKQLSNHDGPLDRASDGWPPSGRRGPGQRAAHIRFRRTRWWLTALPRLPVARLPEAQYSFVVDSRLLLFHQAYFALLPKLEAAGLTEERDELISTFLAFAECVPDMAERFRIAGLAHEARADTARAVASFEKALAASHVDEHVFMTRLQTCWKALLDRGDVRAALELLLRTILIAPLKHFPELRELILATFEEGRHARPEGQAAG